MAVFELHKYNNIHASGENPGTNWPRFERHEKGRPKILQTIPGLLRETAAPQSLLFNGCAAGVSPDNRARHGRGYRGKNSNFH